MLYKMYTRNGDVLSNCPMQKSTHFCCPIVLNAFDDLIFLVYCRFLYLETEETKNMHLFWLLVNMKD